MGSVSSVKQAAGRPSGRSGPAPSASASPPGRSLSIAGTTGAGTATIGGAGADLAAAVRPVVADAHAGALDCRPRARGRRGGSGRRARSPARPGAARSRRACCGRDRRCPRRARTAPPWRTARSPRGSAIERLASARKIANGLADAAARGTRAKVSSPRCWSAAQPDRGLGVARARLDQLHVAVAVALDPQPGPRERDAAAQRQRQQERASARVACRGRASRRSGCSASSR